MCLHLTNSHPTYGDLASAYLKSGEIGDQRTLSGLQGEVIYSRHHGSSLMYSKTCLKRSLSKREKIGFQDQLSLNAGQKYCRMLQGEHSAILLTFIKLLFVIKSFVLSVFEWLL